MAPGSLLYPCLPSRGSSLYRMKHHIHTAELLVLSAAFTSLCASGLGNLTSHSWPSLLKTETLSRPNRALGPHHPTPGGRPSCLITGHRRAPKAQRHVHYFLSLPPRIQLPCQLHLPNVRPGQVMRGKKRMAVPDTFKQNSHPIQPFHLWV